MTLTEFKKSGPWIRIGDRSLAQKRFDAICRLPDGLRKLSLARDTYAAEVVSMYRLKRKQRIPEDQIKHFVQHLCTWLGRWDDFYEERTELLQDEAPPLVVLAAVLHEHWCNECRPTHGWECKTALCQMDDVFPCAAWLKAEIERRKPQKVTT